MGRRLALLASMGSLVAAQRLLLSRSTIYLSTSTLDNARQLLLNAGCVETLDEAQNLAKEHLEVVFRVSIEKV